MPLHGKIVSSILTGSTTIERKSMKFEDCNNLVMLRKFAKFLMGRITELYESIDEAWEEFRDELRGELSNSIAEAKEQDLYEISEHISGSEIG